MERDLELIRELLVRIERDPQLNGSRYVTFDNPEVFAGRSVEELNYHVDLLFEAGFVKGNPASDVPQVSRLTWAGHEFLADTSDPKIWAEIKEHVSALPSVGIALVWELARAALKKKLGLS